MHSSSPSPAEATGKIPIIFDNKMPKESLDYVIWVQHHNLRIFKKYK